jgi:ABC-type Mn2+/Zn2+ transport system permease subunit
MGCSACVLGCFLVQKRVWGIIGAARSHSLDFKITCNMRLLYVCFEGGRPLQGTTVLKIIPENICEWQNHTEKLKFEENQKYK